MHRASPNGERSRRALLAATGGTIALRLMTGCSPVSLYGVPPGPPPPPPHVPAEGEACDGGVWSDGACVTPCKSADDCKTASMIGTPSCVQSPSGVVKRCEDPKECTTEADCAEGLGCVKWTCTAEQQKTWCADDGKTRFKLCLSPSAGVVGVPRPKNPPPD